MSYILVAIETNATLPILCFIPSLMPGVGAVLMILGPPGALCSEKALHQDLRVIKWNGTPFLESDQNCYFLLSYYLYDLEDLLHLSGLQSLHYNMGRKNGLFREELRELMRSGIGCD